jgi:hypothetical protein
MEYTLISAYWQGSIKSDTRLLVVYWFMIEAYVFATMSQPYLARKALAEANRNRGEKAKVTPFIPSEMARVIPPSQIAALVLGKLGDRQRAERCSSAIDVMAEVRGGRAHICRPGGLVRVLIHGLVARLLRRVVDFWGIEPGDPWGVDEANK